MKSTWTVKSLGEISSVGSGNSAPQDPAAFQKGVYPFFRTSDVGKIKNGHISSSADYLNKSGAGKLTKFNASSILFPKCGASVYLNHRVMMDVDGFVSSHLAVITPNKSVVVPTFLLYYLYSVDSADLIQNNDYPTLKIPQISNIRVPVPPISEQRRIVGILDAAFEKIDAVQRNAERNLAKAKELFQRVLDEEMTPKKGWENSALTEVCSHIVDCPHSTPKKVSFPTEYPCIRTSELKNGHIAWETMQYLNEEEYQKRIKRLAPAAGDIVYGREGTFGDAVCLPNSHKFSLGQRTMLFRPDRGKIDSLYLLYFIISNHVYSQIQNNGCGVGHVNVKDIKKFRIFYPASTDVQKKIADKIEFTYQKIQEQTNLFLTVLSESNELKQQILAKAFNGEL